MPKPLANTMKRMTTILLNFKQKDLEMKRQELGAILATQLIECLKNSKYGYMSSVSESHSHLNDPGKEMLMELMTSLVPVAHKIHKEELRVTMEQVMMDNLKK